MGVAPSVVEKVMLDGLLQVADKMGRDLEKQVVVDLLVWSCRRGLIRDPSQVFNNDTWKKVGKELWESVQVGSKGAKMLVKPYREMRLMIEQLNAEVEVS